MTSICRCVKAHRQPAATAAVAMPRPAGMRVGPVADLRAAATVEAESDPAERLSGCGVLDQELGPLTVCPPVDRHRMHEEPRMFPFVR
jgi:hypothetical protein